VRNKSLVHDISVWVQIIINMYLHYHIDLNCNENRWFQHDICRNGLMHSTVRSWFIHNMKTNLFTLLSELMIGNQTIIIMLKLYSIHY